MSFIKRLSTSVFARVDELVGEIENHDALIQAAISEQKKKLATAKLQLSKIQSSEQRVKQQLVKNQESIVLWEERAVKEASVGNEDKALQCLQRKQRVHSSLEKLGTMAAEYRQTASKIERDIQRCEDELKGMVQKHELMRARQSSVDAMHVINEASHRPLDDMQSSLERWEIKLTQNEMFQSSDNEMDMLEQEYVEEEHKLELKHELELLLAESNKEA